MAATHLGFANTTPIIYHEIRKKERLLQHATVLEHIAAHTTLTTATVKIPLRAFASYHYDIKELDIDILQNFLYELAQKSHSFIHPRDNPVASRSMEEYNEALNKFGSRKIIELFKTRYPDSCSKCLYNLSFLYLKACLQHHHVHSLEGHQPRVLFGKSMTRLTRTILSLGFKQGSVESTYVTHKRLTHRFQKAMMHETHYVSTIISKFEIIRSKIALIINHPRINVELTESVRTVNVVASVAQYLDLPLDVHVNWAAVVAALIIMAKENFKTMRTCRFKSRLLFQLLTTESTIATVYIIDCATSKLIFHTN